MPKTAPVDEKAAAAQRRAKEERAAQLLRDLYEQCASGTVRERKTTDEQLRDAQPVQRDQALESESVYLLKQLGRGAFGTVYAAFWSRKHVLVAVKVMSKRKLQADALKFLPRELDNVKVRVLEGILV